MADPRPRRWSAEVYRADRGQIGLRRPGDGRPDSDPWADSGCIYIIGPDEARALAAQLIAAADEVAEKPPTACEGCNADATTQDSMGVPLCDACYDALDPVEGSEVDG